MDPSMLPSRMPSSWRDDQVLLAGLAQLNVALSSYLEHVIRQHTEGAPPLPATVVAGLGTHMVEVGAALASRIVTVLPDYFPAPPFPGDPGPTPGSPQ
ncbi:hypothetical protein [Actinokineospora bangkokensis]|uniref:Uncharacterized protein n=1 Tax=Actinokineospora bangkokensis TaxID=1193682 RepID=A0A1Q9LBZ9_9PSEU|nr:hypothetical protein [Actinokineospora bangkokensis]OLR89543.1 hypothetical protein BJP25_05560 [Actinokineospora bangkokensis]